MKICISLQEQEYLWEQFHDRLGSGGPSSPRGWDRELTIGDIIKYLHVEWTTFEDLIPSGPARTHGHAATIRHPGATEGPEPTNVCDFLDHLTQSYSIDGTQSQKFQYSADRPRICMVQVRRGTRGARIRVVGTGWKRHLPRDPRAPIFILPPWAQPEKMEMSFHCCDVRDLVYLLGDHRQVCDCIVASRQRLGLLHMLHALDKTDDDQDVFSTVVGKAVVERSWCLVRRQYWEKFYTAIVFILALAWFTHQTNNYEPVSMSVVNVLTVISAINVLRFGAELLSCVLEFHYTSIFHYLSVWNAMSGASELIMLCVLLGLRFEPRLFIHTDTWHTVLHTAAVKQSKVTIGDWFFSHRHPGLLTAIAVINWFHLLIYTMALATGYCTVPAWKALLSTDSVSFLVALGILWAVASMCLYAMPFVQSIQFLDAAQVMFRVATVGDGDALFQSPTERPREFPKGDYGSHVVLIFFFLFATGFGVGVCLPLYVSILACSYEGYRGRADHHFNKVLANMMTKFLLQSCLFDRLLRGDARPRRFEELDHLFSGQQLDTEDLDSEEMAFSGTAPGLLIACRQDDSTARRKNSRKLQAFMQNKLRGCGFLLDCRDKPLLGNSLWRSRASSGDD